MKIYKALYNPSCCESSASTISVHRTKLGAYKAIRASKIESFNDWLEWHKRSKRENFKRMAEYGIKKNTHRRI